MTRRYSVSHLDSETRAARRASTACIRAIVHEAAAEKAEMSARFADSKWMARASDMSKKWAREASESTVRALARKRLEYLRMRAFLSVSPERAGSYAPAGWPVDPAARRKWSELNTQSHGVTA